MDLSLQAMAAKLREYPSYRIYFHKSPDGDAVMSAYALALALQTIGIPCEPVCSDPIPETYQDIVAEIPFKHLDTFTAIAVDSADAKRLGKYNIKTRRSLSVLTIMKTKWKQISGMLFRMLLPAAN